MIRSKEGPELSGSKYICYGCVYYDRKMFKSGRLPIYKTTCLKDKNIQFDESYYTPKECPFLDKRRTFTWKKEKIK